MRKKKGAAPLEYHLISLDDGVSYGGFISPKGARLCAYAEKIRAWQIWHGNRRIETHDPGPELDIPTHGDRLRDCAKEARTAAEGMRDPRCRLIMLGLALDYEKWARQSDEVLG
jgi:hypothetical protein